jgi:hypothetical protein
LAESGSGSSDDGASAEVEVEANSDSGSGSGSVEAGAETRMKSNERVGEVKREIKQEIRNGRVKQEIKERIVNESGEFRQEMRQEFRETAQGDRERMVMEFRAKLESNGTVMVNNMKIRLGNMSDEEKEIIAGKINARTGLNLTAEDFDGNGTALRAVLSNGRYAEVKIMPDAAARVAVERMKAKCEERNCTVELREVSEGKNRTRAVYRVETEKEARTLWIFKTRMKVNAEVDSETGDVIRVAKPWWAFLANEKDEVESEADNSMNETEVEVEANASVNASIN